MIFADSLWFNLTLGANIARDKVLEVCEKLDLISLVKEKGFEYYLEIMQINYQEDNWKELNLLGQF